MSQLPIRDGDQMALQGADSGGTQIYLFNGVIGILTTIRSPISKGLSTKGNGQDRGVAFVQMIIGPPEKKSGHSTCHKGDQYRHKKSENSPDFDSGDGHLC